MCIFNDIKKLNSRSCRKNAAFILRTAALFLALILILPHSYSSAYDRTDSYSIISDIVYTYKMRGNEARTDINGMLEDLSELDSDAGRAWTKTMNYWAYVNEDMTVNAGSLPEGLPADDSLCIVVLGYMLRSDGTMHDELVSRLETALRCLEQYPEAYVAVTGGGTALNAEEVTEGGAMAEWLASHGVDPGKIIVEDRSQTTGENAYYTCRIIERDYPQIKSLVIVSSGYHVPLGCLLFQEQLLLTDSEASVISNCGCAADEDDTFMKIPIQASYVWKIYEYNRIGYA